MKIGFVLDDGLDKPDGVQQYILTLGEYFEASGHEVRYLVGETRRTDIDHIYSMAKNVKVRFNGNALSVPLPSSTKKIKHVLKNEKFDVLHIQTPYSPFMGAKVVRNAPENTVIVGTFHILPYGLLSRIGSRLLAIALKPTNKKFDKFISVSQPAADFASRVYGIESVVIPNSVDISRFKPKTPKLKPNEKLQILFLGRLVHRKGCGQLIKALGIMAKNNKLPADWRLDICGEGELKDRLQNEADELGLSQHIKFHGFVSEKQKVEFMQKADISIFPALSGESFGIVLLEAMAAGGGVVLGGNNPGYESVLGNIRGSIIDAHKPEVMAHQLTNLIEDPQKMTDLYNSQQAHIAQFDSPVVADQIVGIYQSCKKATLRK